MTAPICQFIQLRSINPRPAASSGFLTSTATGFPATLTDGPDPRRLCRRDILGVHFDRTRTTVMNHKAIPQLAGRGRECPVCGKPTYSRNGIHPQCAVIQADMPRQKQLAEDKKRRDAEPKKDKPRQSFTKRCPKCKADVHVRVKVCQCGNAF